MLCTKFDTNCPKVCCLDPDFRLAPFYTYHGNAGIDGARDSPAYGCNATLTDANHHKTQQKEEDGPMPWMYYKSWIPDQKWHPFNPMRIFTYAKKVPTFRVCFHVVWPTEYVQ